MVLLCEVMELLGGEVQLEDVDHQGALSFYVPDALQSSLCLTVHPERSAQLLHAPTDRELSASVPSLL